MRPIPPESFLCPSTDVGDFFMADQNVGAPPTADDWILDSYQASPLLPDLLNLEPLETYGSSGLSVPESQVGPATLQASQKLLPPQFSQFDLNLSAQVAKEQECLIDGFGGALKLHYTHNAQIDVQLNYHDGFHPAVGFLDLATLSGVSVRLDNDFVVSALKQQFGEPAALAYQIATAGQEAYFDFDRLLLETKNENGSDVSRLLFEVTVHVGSASLALRLPARTLAYLTDNDVLENVVAGDWQHFDQDFQKALLSGGGNAGGLLLNIMPSDARLTGTLSQVAGSWDLPDGQSVRIDEGLIDFDFSDEAFEMSGDLSVGLGEDFGSVAYSLSQNYSGDFSGHLEGSGAVSDLKGSFDADVSSSGFDWKELLTGKLPQALQSNYYAEGTVHDQAISLDGQATLSADGLSGSGSAQVGRLASAQSTVVKYSLDSDLALSTGQLTLEPFTLTLVPGLDVRVALTSVGSRTGARLQGMASLTFVHGKDPALKCDVPVSVDLNKGLVSFSDLAVVLPDVALRLPDKGITLKAKKALLSGNATYDLHSRCLTGPLKLSVAKASLGDSKMRAEGFVLGSPLTLDARLTGIFDPLHQASSKGGLTLPLEAFEVTLYTLAPRNDGRIQVDVGVSSHFEPTKVELLDYHVAEPSLVPAEYVTSPGLMMSTSPVKFSDRQIALERYGLSAGGESILKQILPNLETGVVRSEGIHLQPDPDGRLRLGALTFKVPVGFTAQLEVFVSQGRISTLDLNFVPPLVGAVRVSGIHFDPSRGQFRLKLDGPAGIFFPDLNVNRAFFEMLGLDDAGLLALEENEGVDWHAVPADAGKIMDTLLFALVYRDSRELFDTEYVPKKSRLDLSEAELIFENLKPRTGTELSLAGLTAVLGESGNKSSAVFSGKYKFSDGRLALSCKGLDRLAIKTSETADTDLMVMKDVDIGSIVYRRTAAATEFTLQNLKVGSMNVEAESLPALNDLVQDLHLGVSGKVQISQMSVLKYADDRADWVDLSLAFTSQEASADLNLALGGKNGRAKVLPSNVGGEAYFRFRTDTVVPPNQDTHFPALGRTHLPKRKLYLESGDFSLNSDLLKFSELAFDPDIEFSNAQTQNAKINVHLGGPDQVTVSFSGNHSWASEQTSAVNFDAGFLGQGSLAKADIQTLSLQGPATLTFTPTRLNVVGGLKDDPFLVTASGKGLFHQSDGSEVVMDFSGTQALDQATVSLSKNEAQFVRVEEVSLHDVDFLLAGLNGHVNMANLQMPIAMDFTDDTGHFAVTSVHQTPESTWLDGAHLGVKGDDAFDVSADILVGSGLVEVSDIAGTLQTQGEGTSLSVASR